MFSKKEVLSYIRQMGPRVLISPNEIIRHCMDAKLMSANLVAQAATTEAKRELLLTILLENCERFLLKQLMRQSSDELVARAGCDAKFYLNWIWERVTYIKKSIDTYALSLFNYSGEHLDKKSHLRLFAFESDLITLKVLLKDLQKYGPPTTEQGYQELGLRLETIGFIGEYLRVLLWLLDCKMLPEHAEGDEYSDESEVIYPLSVFSDSYKSRREEVMQIDDSIVQPTDMLLIDGIVISLGPHVPELWQQGGGDGLYPPPNLHSLLAIYLLKSITLEQKHAIMLYFLLDMAGYLNEKQREVADRLREFPSSFALKPGLTNLIQGVWSLDHLHFEYAYKQLQNSNVNVGLQLIGGDDGNVSVTITGNIQYRIITSFYLQGYKTEALHISRAYGNFDLKSSVREKLFLSLLVFNKQLMQAFNYQRSCRNAANVDEILSHFYHGCEKMGLIEQLFKLPLDEVEENALISYLLNVSTASNAKHLLILYFVLNSKVVDANYYLDKLRHEFEKIRSPELAEKTEHLAKLVSSYVQTMPVSLNKLAAEITRIHEKKAKRSTSKFASALPSIGIRPPAREAKNVSLLARSNIIESVLEQIAQVDKAMEEPHTPVEKKAPFKLSDSPFLCSPLASLQQERSKSSPLPPKYVDTPTLVKKPTPSYGAHLLNVLKTPKVSPVVRTKPPSRISLTPTSILKSESWVRDSASTSSRSSTPSRVHFAFEQELPDEEMLATVPEEKSYEFSEPINEETSRASTSPDSTPKQTFFFSPPTTRAKAKTKGKKTLDEIKEESMQESESRDAEQREKQTATRDQEVATKSTEGKKDTVQESQMETPRPSKESKEKEREKSSTKKLVPKAPLTPSKTQTPKTSKHRMKLRDSTIKKKQGEKQ